MIKIAQTLNYKLCRNIARTASNNSPTINAYLLLNRHKSTNHQNAQKQNQEALKINSKKIECPEPSVNSNSSSSPPPPKNDFTKYIIAGALGVAAISGFLYYKNQESTDGGSNRKGNALGSKKKDKFRSPENSENIPKHIPYLLIGGGTASFAAFRAIKSNDAKAKVLVVSDEAVMPYMRPPLSKEIWFDTQLGVEKGRFKQWNGAERSLFYEPEDFYLPVEKLEEAKNGGVSVIRGYQVSTLNVNEQKVTLDDGTVLTYDKCLIATGSSPKTLDIFETASPKIKEKIFTYKTIKDFEIVKGQVEKAKSIAIVGNGFLGSELACALSHYGQDINLKVYQLFPESGNMAKVLPKYLSEWTTERIKEVGVHVMPESQVTGVEIFNGNQVKLILANDTNIVADFVIQAIGSEPNVKLAKESALEIDPRLGGFVVNAELEARSNLYAAGDVACFYDPRLGRRRVEHHDHAVVSGRLAGENMVGLKKPYKHQSMFWSDLGSTVGYEAIGLIDSTLPTVAIFARHNSEVLKHNDSEDNHEENNEKPVVKSESKADIKPNLDNYDKGVIFYMQKEKIVGILLWNVFNRISIARKILSSDETFSDLNEVAKLFDIFEQHHQQEKEDK